MAGGSVLETGQLRILRQAAVLRLLLLLASAVLLGSRMQVNIWLWVALERALFLVWTAWPALPKRLGSAYLPGALAWLMISPVGEIILYMLTTGGRPMAVGDWGGLVGIGNPMLWLVVPVVLAAWQYRRTGLVLSLIILAAEHIAMAAVIQLNGGTLQEFALNGLGRLAMLALTGYVVSLLVDELRAEGSALQAANRRLTQRAATAEQLAESRERNRLARELHDTLAHSLTGLSIQLQALGAVWEDDPSAARQQLQQAQATAKAGVQEARRAIQSLRATPLEDMGLAEALRQYGQAQAERTGARFLCQIEPLPALDPLTEQGVYRIATSALANVEQHAAAGVVELTLWVRGRTLELQVRDDGVGFAPANVPADRFGLAGMAERAAEIGGRLEVISQASAGARVSLCVEV